MMLVQKPPQFAMGLQAAHFHRRHPSTPPAVIVQPTRTPGLLSLSKPLRPIPSARTQQQQPQHRFQQHKPSSAVAASRSPRQPEAKPKQAEKPATPSPEKTTRGRQQTKPKVSQRSPSNSSVRGNRRNINRQPSPPHPSQAEAPSTPIASFSNTFDPFLSSGSESDSPPSLPRPKLVPKLATTPSGKLARRRQPPPQPSTPTPAPSKAVNVPKARGGRTVSGSTLSRSEPVQSSMPLRPLPPKRAVTVLSSVNAKWDAFPVCNDNDDMSPPSTPTPRKLVVFGDGPRTAPMSTTSAYPFGPSTPSKYHHQRAPSEGIFNMSFDDDAPAAPEDLRAMFGLFSKARFGTPPRDPYFASSMFQNSPSPEELPPPSF